MSSLYVGWDVGAWHCDENPKSQDAICALRGTSLEDLAIDWSLLSRGSLRDRIVSGEAASVALLGRPCNHDEQLVVAIDAPLGWSVEFVNLLADSASVEAVARPARLNPYLFRMTERGLFDVGFTPKSSVQDSIGSQSTKAIYFLQKFEVHPQAPGVWFAERIAAIETYPAPMQDRECSIRRRFHRLYDQEAFDKHIGGTEGARKDGRDALYCALVAAEFGINREGLQPPPESAAAQVGAEGWIWLPKELFSGDSS